MGLLKTLKPKWWFSAHLHTRFEATVPHDDVGRAGNESGASIVANPDEILIEDDEIIEKPANIPKDNPDEITLSDEEKHVQPLPPVASVTKFLALDKCLPKRRFLE
ncbi:hypothetical protein C0993_005385, partial [Termitomyces sp. T159_Od127]